MQYTLSRNSIRKVAALSSGTAIAQILGMFAAPFLTRLYLPSEFGTFAIYLNSVLLLSVVACLRYEMTIMLVKQRRTAVLLVFLSALIAGVVSFSLWVPVIVFEDTIHAMVGLGVESHLLLVLPISLLLAVLYKIASSWRVRSKDFSGLSLSKLWQSLPQMFGQILFGLLHYGVWGLVIGEIVGRLLGFLSLAYRSRELLYIRLPLRFQRARRLLAYYRHYPLYSTWSGLINEAGTLAPVFFLATLYGVKTAGLFALMQRVYALPFDLVSQTASTIYVGEASQAIRTNVGQLPGLFVKVFSSLLVIAVIPATLLICFGPGLFEMVFGHEWYEAGIYAQIMAVAYGVRLAVSPISQTMQMLGRQRFILFLETIRLLSIVSVFAFGYLLTLEVEAVLFWYSVVLISCYVWMFVATWQLVKSVRV